MCNTHIHTHVNKMYIASISFKHSVMGLCACIYVKHMNHYVCIMGSTYTHRCTCSYTCKFNTHCVYIHVFKIQQRIFTIVETISNARVCVVCVCACLSFSLFFSLQIHMHPNASTHMRILLYVPISLSLSLSLYINVYQRICLYISLHIYI